MALGYVLAIQEDPITPAVLGYYDDGAFTATATAADLALATFYIPELIGEDVFLSAIGYAQIGSADKYVKPKQAERSVALTGTLNAYVIQVFDTPVSTVPMQYWTGSTFTAGASALELNTAEIYLDGQFVEADLYARRGYVQQQLSDKYVELTRAAVSVTLV
jgi:hypothetical protein